jgi:hypothetical protein
LGGAGGDNYRQGNKEKEKKTSVTGHVVICYVICHEEKEPIMMYSVQTATKRDVVRKKKK